MWHLQTPTLCSSLPVRRQSVWKERLWRPRHLLAHATVSPEFYTYRSLFGDRVLSVYYRVYTKNGAIPLANPIYSDDPYRGRILADTIAPPHTGNSIKHCISSAENVNGKSASTLFVSVSSETPARDIDRVPILESPGPGWIPNEPMALVTELSSASKSFFKAIKPRKVQSSRGGQTPVKARHGKHNGHFLNIIHCVHPIRQCTIDCTQWMERFHWQTTSTLIIHI